MQSENEKQESASYDFVEPEPPTVEDFSDTASAGDKQEDDEEQNALRTSDWDPETGLYICKRCGRMWDGNAQCFPCAPGP